MLDRNKVETNSQVTDITPKVINFSNYDPIPDELSILKRGVKFNITPKKADLLQLEVDINEFVRKIELISFFNSTNSHFRNEDCLVRKKSDFIPPESKDPLLYNMVKHIKLYAQNLSELPSPQVYNNISDSERNAIYSLKNNQNIIITSVDKGCSLILLNRSDCQIYGKFLK